MIENLMVSVLLIADNNHPVGTYIKKAKVCFDEVHWSFIQKNNWSLFLVILYCSLRKIGKNDEKKEKSSGMQKMSENTHSYRFCQ